MDSSENVVGTETVTELEGALPGDDNVLNDIINAGNISDEGGNTTQETPKIIVKDDSKETLKADFTTQTNGVNIIQDIIDLVNKKINNKSKDNIQEQNEPQLLVKIPSKRSLTLNELVDGLDYVLSKGHYLEAKIFNTVNELIKQYNRYNDLNDYKDYVIWKKNEYTRNLIKKCNNYTLMLLCWPNNICSPIHDHGGSQCWLRVITGNLEERFYNVPDGNKPLSIKFTQKHPSNSVCFINDDEGLHSIACCDQRSGSISLHCYVPGYIECNGYFDVNNANKGKKLCRLNFTSVGGQICDGSNDNNDDDDQ